MIIDCSECGQSFDAAADEFGDIPDVCDKCVFEWTRENVPELLGGQQSEGAE